MTRLSRIARDLSRSFDQYWNNPLAYPVQSLITAEEIGTLKPAPKLDELPGVNPDRLDNPIALTPNAT